ncbi:MAG: N utilization substance protein B [Gammaproteobacteria bacterium RIFCSPHIGHO2_02_FULL_42_13]|nr:MAG: N utilization substance protein B [Gammaproteobacteria bacterium RIFCSPHIGHO2_02_FULL_42_13]OGT70462.1 MAG: N utilization substance protein B [Gammaproteobacteria bacterium RIFCSPLOWO2_02_FULL_42_9]
MNPKARRKARESALQNLYQWLISKNHPKDIVQQFLAEHEEDDIDIEYFKLLFLGATQNVANLDQTILPYLDRPATSLTPVELSVLRLATYELTYCLDVPYRVVINEALELTKQFGSSEGFKYVNGVLDKVAKQVRKDEIK